MQALAISRRDGRKSKHLQPTSAPPKIAPSWPYFPRDGPRCPSGGRLSLFVVMAGFCRFSPPAGLVGPRQTFARQPQCERAARKAFWKTTQAMPLQSCQARSAAHSSFPPRRPWSPGVGLREGTMSDQSDAATRAVVQSFSFELTAPRYQGRLRPMGSNQPLTNDVGP